MKKISRQIITETLWLLLSLGLAILLIFFIFHWTFPSETIDIHLHDTVFVIYRWHILTPIFFLITFIIYVLKEYRKSFKRPLPNSLLILIGITLVILITLLIQIFSQFLTGDWTLYPPLSALGSSESPEMTENPATKFITTFLTVVQIMVIALMLFVAYRWGKRTEKPTLKQLGS